MYINVLQDVNMIMNNVSFCVEPKLILIHTNEAVNIKTYTTQGYTQHGIGIEHLTS